MQTGKTPTFVAAAGLLSVSALAAGNQPHVILIMTDQQTADALQFVGNKNLATPAMDQLAADGSFFNRAYCSYPLSGPSRASLLTGKMPVELNVTDNDDPLPDEEIVTSLGRVMNNAGYECLYAGKWHVPTVEIPDSVFGFRKIHGMNDQTMIQSIRKELAVKRTKPLFLVSSYLNPHEICEYARSQTLPFETVTIEKGARLPSLPSNFTAVKQLPEAVELHKSMSPRLYPTWNYSRIDWRRYLYTYYRLVEKVDRHVGELIQELKKNGIYDESLIVLISDHGDGAAAHQWNQKRALFEETIRVPLIVKTPRQSTNVLAGKQSGALTNIGLDIYPTLCDYAGITVPGNRNGKSLKPLLEGKITTNHNSIMVETLLDGINLRAWCVIEGNYKYVYYRMFKHKEQLFDLKADKGETNNLADNPAYSATKMQLRNTMRMHARQSGDLMLLKDLR